MMNPIRTTHTGSLPRPGKLVEMLVAHHAGDWGEDGELRAATRAAIKDVVDHQREIGLDLINDGEMGKVGYSTYVTERLTGFGGTTRTPKLAELRDFPEYVDRLDPSMGSGGSMPACNAPVRLDDPDAVHRDIEDLLSQTDGDPSNCFMSAASPGVISVFFGNEYYATREEYLGALADAMRPEYQAIVDAGLILQIDCPDLAMGRHIQFARLSTDEFRREAALSVEALNAAVAGLPPDRMRIHLCWGNYEGPHHLDIPLPDIVDVVMEASPNGLCLEASNPRHAHEWEAFRDFSLPADKYLVPGVIDSTSNYIEHPDLVAQRILRYADVVGRDRVMAGSDCGFGSFAGLAQVEPKIAWAKLATLVEGARRASNSH